MRPSGYWNSPGAQHIYVRFHDTNIGTAPDMPDAAQGPLAAGKAWCFKPSFWHLAVLDNTGYSQTKWGASLQNCTFK